MSKILNNHEVVLMISSRYMLHTGRVGKLKITAPWPSGMLVNSAESFEKYCMENMNVFDERFL